VAYRVRAADLDDADMIARVHVRAWRAAYRQGLMPDEYLDTLSEADWAGHWRVRLADAPPAGTCRLVAVDEDGNVAGFVVAGPARSKAGSRRPAGPTVGEVLALNVDPDRWGTGAGCDLLASAVDRLERAGFQKARLWVHSGSSRARRFYERHGWSPDGGERSHEVRGVTVAETRYRRDFG
jgi:RimJ/RimL family protein N-acetyltransferase